MESTIERDVTAVIAVQSRKLYRGEIAAEAVASALAKLPEGTEAAAGVLRAYHDRWHWLLCDEGCEATS